MLHEDGVQKQVNTAAAAEAVSGGYEKQCKMLRLWSLFKAIILAFKNGDSV